MGDATPIRPGIELMLDYERELLDWCKEQIVRFREGSGLPPRRIAMVLLNSREPGRNQHSLTRTWDADDKASKAETCALAAMLLHERGMGR